MNASVALPPPHTTGTQTVEKLLAQRRSVRSFSPTVMSLAELGQLLWAAQGITDSQGLRTAPSAGALYPLALYVVVGAVEDLAPGVYHYRPEAHELVGVADGDQRRSLARAALNQPWVEEGAVVVVFAAEFARTRAKYGERATRYVHMEVGHASENLFLQAEALGLATVVVGAFDDDAVAKAAHLPAGIRPLNLMPVGRAR